MIRTDNQIKDALAIAFAKFAMLAKHSLTPTQTKVATEGAGHCLWALGVDDFRGFKAVPCEALGEEIECVATLVALEAHHG